MKPEAIKTSDHLERMGQINTLHFKKEGCEENCNHPKKGKISLRNINVNNCIEGARQGLEQMF